MGKRGPRQAKAFSPAARELRRVLAAATEADRRGIPVEEVLGEHAKRAEQHRRNRELEREQAAEGLTRRSLIGRGAAAGAGLMLGGGLGLPAAARAAGPRVAIVGGGLAGIRCAHLLWNNGNRVASTVYEANPDRIGGRCWSLRGFFSNGLIGEHGGAFINQNQTAIRNLATSLGLTQEVVNGGLLPQGESSYWYNGARYSVTDAANDWRYIGYPAFQAAQKAAPWPQTYNAHTAEGVRLDNLTVPEWLDETGIGASSRFGQLMLADTTSEWGGDPSAQSALNLVSLLAWNSPNSLEPLPGDDEKYHLVGGNDQLITRMVAQLPAGTVKRGHRLVAVRANSNGTTTLSFDTASKTVDVVADRVVLALPFATLRQVDLNKSGLSKLKRKAIAEKGMGTNAKVHLQVNRKSWAADGLNGEAYSDWDGFCVAWDDSVPLGTGAPAILLAFPGGRGGSTSLTGPAHGPAPAADVNRMLERLDPIFPGTRAAFSGIAYEDHWSLDPNSNGAYSFQKPGQYTTIFGSEGLAEGSIHFAGEHTEPEDQGFLNGGVVSGERTAKEVLLAI
jgi:monoamine oxidase